jgi:hypothetical protein
VSVSKPDMPRPLASTESLLPGINAHPAGWLTEGPRKISDLRTYFVTCPAIFATTLSKRF